VEVVIKVEILKIDAHYIGKDCFTAPRPPLIIPARTHLSPML